MWICTIFDPYTNSEGTHGAGLSDSISLHFYFFLSHSLKTTKFELRQICVRKVPVFTDYSSCRILVKRQNSNPNAIALENFRFNRPEPSQQCRMFRGTNWGPNEPLDVSHRKNRIQGIDDNLV